LVRRIGRIRQIRRAPGAPVLTTTKCKGMIPEDHPLRAGCIIGGLIERKLVLESDLIVTVGLDAVELQPKPWPYTLPVLALSSVPSVDALVPADPESSAISNHTAGLAQWAPQGTNWGEKSSKAFRTEVRDALNTPSTGLSPQRAMEVARAILPRNTIATCDAGAAGCWWCRNGNPTDARVPDLQRPRLHGLRGSRRAGGAHGFPGSSGGRLHRRWRLPDDDRRIADRAAREPADHRAGVR